MAFEYIKNTWCTDTTGVTFKTAMSVDTDEALFDDDMMIAIVKFEWLEDEGQPSNKAAREAGEALDRLTGNDASSSGIAIAGDIFAQNSRHFSGTPKASRSQYGGYF